MSCSALKKQLNRACSFRQLRPCDQCHAQMPQIYHCALYRENVVGGGCGCCGGGEINAGAASHTDVKLSGDWPSKLAPLWWARQLNGRSVFPRHGFRAGHWCNRLATMPTGQNRKGLFSRLHESIENMDEAVYRLSHQTGARLSWNHDGNEKDFLGRHRPLGWICWRNVLPSAANWMLGDFTKMPIWQHLKTKTIVYCYTSSGNNTRLWWRRTLPAWFYPQRRRSIWRR